jgi:hypothetical protein
VMLISRCEKPTTRKALVVATHLSMGMKRNENDKAQSPKPDENSRTPNVCRIPWLLHHTSERIPPREATFRVVIPSHLHKYVCLEQAHPPTKDEEEYKKRDGNQFRGFHS